MLLATLYESKAFRCPPYVETVIDQIAELVRSVTFTTGKSEIGTIELKSPIKDLVHIIHVYACGLQCANEKHLGHSVPLGVDVNGKDADLYIMPYAKMFQGNDLRHTIRHELIHIMDPKTRDKRIQFDVMPPYAEYVTNPAEFEAYLHGLVNHIRAWGYERDGMEQWLKDPTSLMPEAVRSSYEGNMVYYWLRNPKLRRRALSVLARELL